MQLQCKYCREMQPVTVADEADEDARTQSIRRAFRADHLARCGERAVALVLGDPDLEPVDPAMWNAYLADRCPPDDVTLGADGFFTRTIVRDGASHNVRVCEDCWQTIPRYVDFSWGLTSPESDGAGGAIPKIRPGVIDTENPGRSAGVEHVRRVVCLPCYLAAFARVHPDAAQPVLSAAVIGDGKPIEAPTAAPYIFIAADKSVSMERAPIAELIPPPDDPRWREADAATQA